MIEKMIAQVFKARNAAHGQHWKTNNGEQHRALGEFYDEAIDVLDRYVETHQGLFGLVGDTPDQTKDITNALRDQMIWLTKNRAEVTRDIPPLQNIYDELTAVYLKTLYKLEHLR